MEPETDEVNFTESDNAALQIINDEDTLRFLTAEYIGVNNNTKDEIPVMKESKTTLNTDLEKLRLRYAEILDEIKPSDDPSNAFKMLEKVQGIKTSEYHLLSKTISSLVKALTIDDIQDDRIDHVVLLVSGMFTALKQFMHEINVQDIIRRRVKSAVKSNKQRNKDHLQFGNIDSHISDLYELYPEVGALRCNQLSTSPERPYRDTVLKVMEAIGIQDSNDVRIDHAVTLAMDQYSVLRDQITNQNLRKQFLSRIKRHFLNATKRKVECKTEVTCEIEAIGKKKLRLQDESIEKEPPRIKLVIEHDEELPKYPASAQNVSKSVKVCETVDSNGNFIQKSFTVNLENMKYDQCT